MTKSLPAMRVGSTLFVMVLLWFGATATHAQTYWTGAMNGPPQLTIDAKTVAAQVPPVASHSYTQGDTPDYCIIWKGDKLKKPKCNPLYSGLSSLERIDPSKPAMPGVMSIAEAEQFAGTDKLMVKSRGTPFYYRHLAEAAMRGQRYESALNLLNLWLKKGPWSEQAWFYRAQIYVLAGRDDLALPDIEAALFWNNKNSGLGYAGQGAIVTRPLILLLRSHIHLRRGKLDLAQADLAEADAIVQKFRSWGSNRNNSQWNFWAENSKPYGPILDGERRALASRATGLSVETAKRIDIAVDHFGAGMSGCADTTDFEQARAAGYRLTELYLARARQAKRCKDAPMADRYFTLAASHAETEVQKANPTQQTVRLLNTVLIYQSTYLLEQDRPKEAAVVLTRRVAVLRLPNSGSDANEVYNAEVDVEKALRKVSAGELASNGVHLVSPERRTAITAMHRLADKKRAADSDFNRLKNSFSDCRRRLAEAQQAFAGGSIGMIHAECEDIRKETIASLEAMIVAGEETLRLPALEAEDREVIQVMISGHRRGIETVKAWEVWIKVAD